MRVSWWRNWLRKKARPQRRRRSILGVECLEDRLVPSTLDVWTGGVDNQWSTAGNWSNGVPTAGEIAQFTGTGTAHANDAVVIDGATQTVDGIEIDARYTSTITLQAALVLSNAGGAPGSFIQAGGTFDAGSNTISVAGDWTVTGGTFKAGTGTVVFDGAAQNLTSGGNAFANLTHNGTDTLKLKDTLNVAGTLSNAGGTLDLNGYSATSGSTTVSGGTLLVDGAFSGSVTVNSPGTLAGTNTITGSVSGNGTIAPGTASTIGTLTVSGDVTLPGTLAFRVNWPYTTAGTDYDQLVVSGKLDLTGANLTFDGTGATAAPAPQQLMTLIRNTGGSATVTDATTTPAAATPFALGAGSFDVFYNGGTGNDVVLVDARAPTVAYVSPTFAGDNPGQAIADADLGAAGAQPAVFGVNAFASIGAAVAAIASSGQVIVNAGSYAEAVSLSGTQTLTVTGGAAVTVNSLSTPAGATVQINGTSLILGDATSTTIAGGISGSGQLIKQGGGAVTLAGTDTYTGDTTVKAGALEVDGSLAGNVIVNSAGTVDGTGTIGGSVFGAGTLHAGTSATIGILNINGGLTLSGTLPFRVNAPYLIAGVDYDQMNVGGTIDLSGATLNITGGTAKPLPQQELTLIQNNSGTATIATGATPGDGTMVTLGSALFTLFYNGGADNDVGLVDASIPTVAYVSGTFTGDKLGKHIADADFGTTGKQPAVFGVNAFATIGAALAVIANPGTVIVNQGTYADAVTLTSAQTLTITGNAAVTINSLTTPLGATVQLADGSQLTLGDATSTTVAGVIAGTGQLVKQGTGTVTLSGIDTYTGDTDVNAGTLQISGSSTSNTVVNAGTGQITGSVVGTATVNGGSLQVSGSLSGNVTVNGGTLQITSPVTGNATVNGGTLEVDGTLTGSVTVSGTGTLDGTGTVTGNVSGTGTVAPGTSTSGMLTIGGQLTQPGTLRFRISAYSVAGTDFDRLIVGGTVDLTGTSINVSAGPGGIAAPMPLQLVTLLQNNSGSPITPNPLHGTPIAVGTANFRLYYDGGTGHDLVLVNAAAPAVAYVSPTFAGTNGGQVIANPDLGNASPASAIFDVDAFATIGDALAAVTSTGQVIVNTGTYLETANVGTRTLTVTNGAAVTINALNTLAGATVQINGTALTLGNPADTTAVQMTVAGLVNGAGQLIKQGAGTLTLAGSDTYTGATNVNAGTLRITKSLSNNTGSVVNLNGAATLDGAGTGQLLRPVYVTAAGATIQNITVQATATDGITLQTGAVGTTINATTVTGSQNGIVATGAATANMTGDTISANSGNGINIPAAFGGALTLVNSTVTGNAGAGIAVAGGTAGTLTLQFDTVAFNTAGGLNNSAAAASVTAQDSLFADNTPFDYRGPVTSNGNNLIQMQPGAATIAGLIAAPAPNADLTNRPALLAALGAYGGTTQTVALLPGSAALGAGAAIIGIGADQRGTARLTSTPDIGAFQSQGFTLGAATPTTGNTYRTLINNFFVQNDGSTPQSFQATVSSSAGEPIAGGMIVWTTPAGTSGGSPAPSATPVGLIQSVSPTTSKTANTITLALPPGVTNSATPFFNGEALIYDDGGTTPIGGLLEGYTYYAGNVSGASLQLTDAKGTTIKLTPPATLGKGQMLVPTLSAAGTPLSPTQVFASSTASPADSTTYALTASAGGQNPQLTWSLYNQQVAQLVFGTSNTSFQPQNAQSGVGSDNPTGGGIQFAGGGAGGAGGAGAANAFIVTLYDQETTLPAQKVVISGQSVSLGAVYNYQSSTVFTAGTIYAASGLNNTALTVGKNGLFTTTTAAGVATFMNLQIYQSIYNTNPTSATPGGYRLRLSFTNPVVGSTPVTQVSNAFSVLPNQLAVTASSFTGFLQKAYTIIIAASSRGDIRLLNITAGGNGLPNDAVKVVALDYSPRATPTAPTLALSTTYNGPVTLTAMNGLGLVTLQVWSLTPAGKATPPVTYSVTPPFTMVKGSVIAKYVSPNVAFGTFSLFADTQTASGDPAGAVDVTTTTNKQQATFIRVNSGRQRGR